MSSIQSDTLFVLLAIEGMGNTNPVPLVNLLGIINKSRSPEIFPQALRLSMHTLVKHKLLTQYRDPKSLKLAYRLSGAGRLIAVDIMNERNESNQ
jgi:hypothetical protein